MYYVKIFIKFIYTRYLQIMFLNCFIYTKDISKTLKTNWRY